jgi:hypothetical protein
LMVGQDAVKRVNGLQDSAVTRSQPHGRRCLGALVYREPGSLDRVHSWPPPLYHTVAGARRSQIFAVAARQGRPRVGLQGRPPDLSGWLANTVQSRRLRPAETRGVEGILVPDYEPFNTCSVARYWPKDAYGERRGPASPVVGLRARQAAAMPAQKADAGVARRTGGVEAFLRRLSRADGIERAGCERPSLRRATKAAR